MKNVISVIFRIFFNTVLLYFVYKETGPFTTIAILLNMVFAHFVTDCLDVIKKVLEEISKKIL